MANKTDQLNTHSWWEVRLLVKYIDNKWQVTIMANSNLYVSRYINLNGVDLRYLDWGTQGKPSLICLHGNSGQAHIWDEFAEKMAEDYHVYAIDQRGHGESSWAPDGYHRNHYVSDLTAFIDAMKIEKVVLVGLSMRGWNSLLYAEANP